MNQQDQPSSNTSEEKKNFDSDKEEIFRKNSTKTDDYTLSATEELKSQYQLKLEKNRDSAKKENILPAKDINLDKKEIGEINKNKIIESAKQEKKENKENNENKIFGEVDEESQESEESEENSNRINIYPKKKKEEKEEKNILNKEKSSLQKNNQEKYFQILPNKMVTKKEALQNDTFCESFFMVSFSKNCKFIKDSVKYKADCNHEICNSLYAIEPEIIYKYEKNKDVLELNEIAASTLFPCGIKLCYGEDGKKIKTVKNYSTIFTNPIGDRFFAYIYHFYIKKKNIEFESNYEMTPIKYEEKKYRNDIDKYKNEIKKELSQEDDEYIFNRLEMIGKIQKKKEFVYIPYGLCLVSKYPFFNQMEKALESIAKALTDDKLEKKELNKYISYLVNSIPVPSLHRSVFFPLYYNYQPVEIRPSFMKGINMDVDHTILLSKMSEENILILFKMLLFEKKVIIVGKNNKLISSIILNFLSLLYPFEWIHICIPVMSFKMLKLLEGILPFLYGMNENLFSNGFNLFKNGKIIYIYNLDNGNFEINTNYYGNRKYVDPKYYIENNILNLPNYLEEILISELKSMKMILRKSKNDNKILEINLRMKNLFMQIFAELLCDWEHYSYKIDDHPVFNEVKYLEKKEKKYKNFYNEFSSTQLFQLFIQNQVLGDNKDSYFEKRLSDFEEVKKTKKSIQKYLNNLFKKLKDDYVAEFPVITKKKMVKPFFIKKFEEFEQNYLSTKKKEIRFGDIVDFLLKTYNTPIFTETNLNGILLEDKRIFENPKELTDKDDPKQLQIYYIPGQEKKTEKKPEENNIKEKRKLSTIFKLEGSDKKNKFNIFQIKKIELNENEMDEIRDDIIRIMLKIFKSTNINIDENKQTLFNCLKTTYGLKIFISIIYQNKVNKVDMIKEVSVESFNLLRDVIFQALLNISNLGENDNNLEDAVKLIKCCKNIKKIEETKKLFITHTKDYSLFDEICLKLDGYSFLEKEKFWKIWIELDLTEDDLEILKKLKEKKQIEKDIYEKYENHLCELISYSVDIMLKMKMGKISIFTNISVLGEEYFLEEQLIENLEKKALNEIKNSK